MKICSRCQNIYPDDFSLCPRDGAPLASQATATEAQLAAGLSRRYRIIRRLGQGGMGAVFLAEQIAVGNRAVALKVLNRKLLDDPEFLLRFQNEAGSTGRIRHVNVVTIFESGQADDGTPYIAMEFLEGESLRDALKRRGALPLAEVAEILQQAARGLNAAHKLGIIHRDLKPDNIFLTYPDDEFVARVSPPANARDVGAGLVPALSVGVADTGRAQDPPPPPVVVKVVDFGIAKLRESATHTMTGLVLGTPAYMSFEQASGMRSDELDARSDVYSLGVVVYEALTGRVPFHSDTPLGYVRKHMMEDPPPFRAVAPGLGVPPAVESAVMKALVKDRDRRYASALDFARAVAVASQPALAAVSSPRAEVPIPSFSMVPPRAAEASPPPPSTKVSPSPTAREPAAPVLRAASAPVPADVAVQTPPPTPVERVVEPPRPQPVRSEPATAPSRPVVARTPQFGSVPEPPNTKKFVAIAAVALILLVAAVWYFSSSPNPPVENPQDGIGTSPTGTGLQVPGTQNPEPPSPTPTANDTSAATRLRQVEAAKSRGDSDYDNGQYDNAMSAYQAGLKLDPSNAELLQALKRAQTAKSAEEQFNNTNTAGRLQQVEAAKRQGDNYYDGGLYDKAINAYQGGLRLDPSNAQLLQALQRAQTAKSAEDKFSH